MQTMRRLRSPEVVRVDEASPESSFRELDDVFLQTQMRIWLGEVLHLRFDEEISVADLLADGELLFQVSKVIWKMLLKKNKEQLKQSKVCIYERTCFGKSNARYMPYPKVDSFLKICQILGLTGIDLFTPSDVVEKRDVRRVCMCNRSLSKKARLMSLNVPDFDIVTYTISMPSYIVGGIRRNWEQSQCSSSSSSGYSPRTTSRESYRQRMFSRHNNQHDDTHYDSDETESRLCVLEREDSVDEYSFAMFLQLSKAPQVRSASYGESEHDIYYYEQSLAESVDSLNFGMIKAGCAYSTSSMYDEESSYSTPYQSYQCLISRTSITCPLSLEKSSCLGSESDLGSSKNYLDSIPPTISKRIYEGHVQPSEYFHGHPTQLCSSHTIPDQERTEDGKAFSGDPDKETDDIQKDNTNFEPYCEQEACNSGRVDCNNCKSVLTEKYTTEETSGNHGSCSGLLDHYPSDESNILQFGSQMQNDALIHDMESVDSSSEEVRLGLQRESSDLTSSSVAFSELTSTPTIDSKLPSVSEDYISGCFLSPKAYFPNALQYISMELTPSECFTSSCSIDSITTNVHSIQNLEKRIPTSSSREGGRENSTNIVSSESRKPVEWDVVGIEQPPCKGNVRSNLTSNLSLSVGRCLNFAEVLNEVQSVSCDHSISQIGLPAQIDEKGLCRGLERTFDGGTSENDKNNFSSGVDACSHDFCSSSTSKALRPAPVPGTVLTEQERHFTSDFEIVRKQLLDKGDSEELVIGMSNAHGSVICPTVSASANDCPPESSSGSLILVSDISSHDNQNVEDTYTLYSGIANFSRQTPQKTITEGDKILTIPFSGSPELLTPSPTDIVCSSVDQEPIGNIEAFRTGTLETIHHVETSGNGIVSLNILDHSLNAVIPTNKMTQFKDDHIDQCKKFTPEHGEVQGESTEQQLNIEQDGLLETENGSASQLLEAEYDSQSRMDIAQCGYKPATTEDTNDDNSGVQRARNGVRESGKVVLKSVAGGITLVGAVFFILRLRKSREKNFTTVVPSQSGK